MTQILAYQSPAGIVLGTDSRALHYRDDGSTVPLVVSKLFALTPDLILVTAGSGCGIPACQALQAHVKDKGLWNVADIAAQALPLLRSEWQRRRREATAKAGPADLERVYFVLAGRDLTRDEDPYRLLLWGAEQRDAPLEAIAHRGIFTIPRQLALEAQLFRMQQTGAPLARVRALMQGFLYRLLQQSDAVGAPLHVLGIDRKGMRYERFPRRAGPASGPAPIRDPGEIG